MAVKILVEDLSRSERPLTSNIDENVDKMKKIVLANCISEKEIASILSISNGSIYHILTEVLDQTCSIAIDS